MKQYFDNDAQFIDDLNIIYFELDGIKLKFETNSGMFSKEHIDSYSIFLVTNIEEKSYDNILDLGCGYGFIGIYLAKKLQYKHISFSDITTRACEYTNRNCKHNNIENYSVINIDGVKSDVLYNLITLNPPIHAGKDVVYRLYDEAMSHLSKDGNLYVVLHKNHGAKSTIQDLEAKYKIEIVNKRKSLFVLRFSNRYSS